MKWQCLEGMVSFYLNNNIYDTIYSYNQTDIFSIQIHIVTDVNDPLVFQVGVFYKVDFSLNVLDMLKGSCVISVINAWTSQTELSQHFLPEKMPPNEISVTAQRMLTKS